MCCEDDKDQGCCCCGGEEQAKACESCGAAFEADYFTCDECGVALCTACSEEHSCGCCC